MAALYAAFERAPPPRRAIALIAAALGAWKPPAPAAPASDQGEWDSWLALQAAQAKAKGRAAVAL